MSLNRWMLPLLLLHSAIAIGDDELTQAPDVPSPLEVDPISLAPPSGSQRRSSAQRAASIKLRAVQTDADSGSRQSATKIGLVRFSPGLLSRPLEMEIDFSKPVVVMGLPSSMARLDLQLDGQEFQLYFGDDAIDAMTGFRHVAMSVLNDTTATARFTISGDGRSIYGVLRTSESTYLLEPSATPGEQVVYRYPKTLAVDDRRRGLVGNSQLARRHHQLEAVAELQPSYSYSNAYSAYLIGGNLGTVESTTPTSFVRSAELLSSATQFTGTEKFESVATWRTNDGGRLAIFRQVFDGIAVDTVNEMVVDRNGKILRLATSIVPSDVLAARPLLSASDAEAKALLEWEARYGKRQTKLQAEPPLRVLYRFNRTAMALELQVHIHRPRTFLAIPGARGRGVWSRGTLKHRPQRQLHIMC